MRAVTANPGTETKLILINYLIRPYENLSPVYSIVTEDFNNMMSFLDKEVLFGWLPWRLETNLEETTITRKRTDTKPELTSTVSTTSNEHHQKKYLKAP